MNENNQEVLFDVQFNAGPFGQGGTRFSYYLPGIGASSGGWAVPIQDLVNAYEMADSSMIDPPMKKVGIIV